MDSSNMKSIIPLIGFLLLTLSFIIVEAAEQPPTAAVAPECLRDVLAFKNKTLIDYLLLLQYSGHGMAITEVF